MQNGSPTIASLDDVAFERPPSLIDDLDGLTRMRSRSGDRDAADATFAVERFPVDEADAVYSPNDQGRSRGKAGLCGVGK